MDSEKLQQKLMGLRTEMGQAMNLMLKVEDFVEAYKASTEKIPEMQMMLLNNMRDEARAAMTRINAVCVRYKMLTKGIG